MPALAVEASPGDGHFLPELPVDMVALVALVALAVDLPSCARLRRVSRGWDAAVTASLSQRQHLDLFPFRARMDDAGVAALARLCPKLKSVSLCACARLDDAALAALASHCPRLKSVNVSCVRTFTLKGLQDLKKACPLEDLELSGCALEVSDIRLHFAGLYEMENEDEEEFGSTD
ncbi:hypothetical protein T492DRAFT_1027452 [Pavlovales sp. CCMP2436]|nr:hypothetical protein T492DRAFT_1027452 [Pavlovales sp. CCMP2436]